MTTRKSTVGTDTEMKTMTATDASADDTPREMTGIHTDTDLVAIAPLQSHAPCHEKGEDTTNDVITIDATGTGILTVAALHLDPATKSTTVMSIQEEMAETADHTPARVAPAHDQIRARDRLQ